jgi:F-type H+-transporting ATPase subunit gamma
MPGLKEVRIRIVSVNNTKQITSAMKMVSAAKLRKAQTAILKLRPYANKLNELISNLSAGADVSDDVVYFRTRPEKKVLLVVVSSNRGLCGAFNSNIMKAAVAHINKNFSQQYQSASLDLITIGKKATEFFLKRKFNVVENLDSIYEKLSYDNAGAIAQKLMDLYAKGTYDRIDIVYNQFKNAVTQILKVEPFLPIRKVETSEAKTKTNIDYIFEPSQEEILTDLVPRSLKIQIYKAILDSWASEQGARMSAMQKASDNADELIKSLKLSYNKARQASITREIIEIVSGVNALKG